jgi:polyisoprenoid-binding protein YceI
MQQTGNRPASVFFSYRAYDAYLSATLKIMSVFVGMITSLILLVAFTPSEKLLYSITKGTIRFTSDAPMENIRGSSQQLKGMINPANRTFAFSLNNHTITGFNSRLQQEHFYENYIEADQFPKSSFEGKIIEQVDFTNDGEMTVRAKGMLNIHGVSRERIIKSSLQIKGGILRVKSHFTILLEEHNIKIPRIVFQKIAQEISIDVEAEYVLSERAAK